MSFAIASGLAVAVACGLAALVESRKSRPDTLARGFARQWRLPLIPEIVAWVARRVRVRMLATFLALGVLGGLAIGTLGFVFISSGPDAELLALTIHQMAPIGVWIAGVAANATAVAPLFYERLPPRFGVAEMFAPVLIGLATQTVMLTPWVCWHFQARLAAPSQPPVVTGGPAAVQAVA